MKKNLLWVVFLILSVLIPAIAFGGETVIQFAWDANNDGNWTGVKIFQRASDGSYDYTDPIVQVPITYVDNVSEPISTNQLPIRYPDGVATTYQFVARAFDDQGNESGDSNEVEITYDATELPSFSATGAYNEEDDSLHFTWVKNDDRIETYKIFHRTDPTAEFVELLEMAVADGESQTATIPKGDLFPDGQETTQYFQVVAYTSLGVWRNCAQDIEITLDYRPLETLINFRIELE